MRHDEINMTEPRGGILCIGDIDVDMIIAVPEVPGPDEKINGSLTLRSPGGMGANVAVGLARMGAPVRLVAAIGDDENGRFLQARLKDEGVDPRDLIVRVDAETFTCIVLVSDAGEKSLVRVVTDAYLPRPDDIDPAIFDCISHLHMTLGSAELTEQMFGIAKQHGHTTSLDLEAADIRHADITCVTRVLAMTDLLFCSEKALTTARSLLAQHDFSPNLVRGLTCVVVTRGAEGARLISDEALIEVQGHNVTPRDTTGAGDSFVATFLAARHDGQSFDTCLTFANAAGAMATLEIGAQTALPDLTRLQRFLQKSADPSKQTSQGPRASR